MVELLRHFFDVNNTFFTLLDYPISYLEFVGTIFNLVCVLLAAKRKIANWFVGLFGALLFGILFFKINLYADFFEQIYYFITGIIGWIMWQRTKEHEKNSSDIIASKNTLKTNAVWIVIVIMFSYITSLVLFNINKWLPNVFPEPASFVVIDSTTTVMSFAAQILMIQRKIESWYIWMIVNIIAIFLYWHKAIPFVSILYIILLANSIYGYLDWKNSMKLAPVNKDA